MILRTQRLRGLPRGLTRGLPLPQRVRHRRRSAVAAHGVQAAVLTLLGIGKEVVLGLHLGKIEATVYTICE